MTWVWRESSSEEEVRMKLAVGLVLLGSLSVSGCCGANKGLEKYECKSKQAEAKAQLATVVAAMSQGLAESGSYPNSVDGLKKHGFDPSAEYYDLAIVSADAESFVVEARGKGEMKGDLWRVDEKRNPKLVNDVCK